MNSRMGTSVPREEDHEYADGKETEALPGLHVSTRRYAMHFGRKADLSPGR